MQILNINGLKAALVKIGQLYNVSSLASRDLYHNKMGIIYQVMNIGDEFQINSFTPDEAIGLE